VTHKPHYPRHQPRPVDRLYTALLAVPVPHNAKVIDVVDAFVRATLDVAGVPCNPGLYKRIMLALAKASAL